MDARELLREAEARIRELREEKARANKLADAAHATATANREPGDRRNAAIEAKKQATAVLRAIDRKIDAATAESERLLGQIGDQEAAGFPLSGINGISGWHQAADRLSLSEGALRVDVAGIKLLEPSTSPPLPRTPTGATAAAPVTSRWLFPVFEAVPFGLLPGDLTATDYTVEFGDAPGSALTGVEIPVVTDTPKATLDVSAALATPTAREFAVVANNLPSRLFDSKQALRNFLSSEMSRRLSAAFDDHVVGAIESAAPPSGSTGSDLVAKIRNAIAAMRDLGAEPSVIALTPADAASLDLTQDAGGYVFHVGFADGADGVWSLRVREAPAVSDPLLVDPGVLGVSYVGDGSVLADPYGANLNINRVSVRVEVAARFHVRNVEQGAYVIA